MDANQNIERAYELLEKFDFNELSEKDRLYILSVMTENEYGEMRDTIKDTDNFFVKSVEPV
jgi:hypothetical protein